MTVFRPATQAIFIAALLRKQWQAELRVGEIVGELGYTAMTLSRAVRELAVAGLVTARQEGRMRGVRVNHPPAEAWEHAAPYLRSPVRRVMWVVDRPGGVKGLRLMLAGLSALASCAMLVEPEHPVYALSPEQWKLAQQANVKILPASQPDAAQWEVWRYTPGLMTRASKIVDPLSLTLSLKDEQDDRVQQALEQLRSQFPW